MQQRCRIWIQTRPVQLPLAGALFPEDAAEMSNLDLNSASPTAYSWCSLSRRCSRDVESGSKLTHAVQLPIPGDFFPEHTAEISDLDLNSRPIQLPSWPEDAAKMSNLDLNSASPTAYSWCSHCTRCSRDVESGSKLGQSNCLLGGALFPEDATKMSNLDLNSASPTA